MQKHDDAERQNLIIETNNSSKIACKKKKINK